LKYKQIPNPNFLKELSGFVETQQQKSPGSTLQQASKHPYLMIFYSCYDLFGYNGFTNFFLNSSRC
jgi:hypothetical protein